MKPFEDPTHRGNGPRYRSGRMCIEPGCHEPAGTWWSPCWCQKHNAERINRISKGIKDLVSSFKEDPGNQRQRCGDCEEA